MNSGISNLRPSNTLSKEEVRSMASKGGKKSVEVRKKIREKEAQLKILKGAGLIDKLLESPAPLKIQEQIKKEFGDTLPEGVELTYEYAMVIQQAQQAMKGHLPATQFLLERVYGKALQKQEIANDSKVVFISKDDVEEADKHIDDVITNDVITNDAIYGFNVDDNE